MGAYRPGSPLLLRARLLDQERRAHPRAAQRRRYRGTRAMADKTRGSRRPVVSRSPPLRFHLPPPRADPEAHHRNVAARMQSRRTGEGHLPQHAARVGELADPSWYAVANASGTRRLGRPTDAPALLPPRPGAPRGVREPDPTRLRSPQRIRQSGE